MTKFYLIRHGHTDYSGIDQRNFVGQGRDLAALSTEGVEQIRNLRTDERLMNCEIIISSPYTRALQSAAILSKELGVDIKIEIDLHEWVPDIVNYRHDSKSRCSELLKEYRLHNGAHPDGCRKEWETALNMKRRITSVLELYKNYTKVIVLSHGMLLGQLVDLKDIENAEIIEYCLD